MKFRSRSVTVEAVQWTESTRLEVIRLLLSEDLSCFSLFGIPALGNAVILTLHGKTAALGDWIIKAGFDEARICPHAEFEAGYSRIIRPLQDKSGE